jgi:hypothetical protein
MGAFQVGSASNVAPAWQVKWERFRLALLVT